MAGLKVLTGSPARNLAYLEEYCENSSRAIRTGAISSTARRIASIAGSCAGRIASAKNAPPRTAASAILSKEDKFTAAGFSQRTGIPLSRKYTLCASWSAFGDAM